MPAFALLFQPHSHSPFNNRTWSTHTHIHMHAPISLARRIPACGFLFSLFTFSGRWPASLNVPLPRPRRPVGTFRTAGVDCQSDAGVETRTENPLGRSREARRVAVGAGRKTRSWGLGQDSAVVDEGSAGWGLKSASPENSGFRRWALLGLIQYCWVWSLG